MTPRIALAVAPAGPLGLSQARQLLLAWLLGRRLGGEVILRIEGAPRPEQRAAAETDLRWLGLDWDEVSVRAEHPERYTAAAEALKAAGRLYPCFESEAELNAKRERRLREGRAALYDRAMLRLTPEQRAAAEAGGKLPYWRFLLSGRPVAWEDLVLGRTEVKLPAMSDPVLVAADGAPLGLLAAVADAAAERVTHVVRAAELIGQSGLGRDVLAALGAPAPALAHPAGLAGPDGGRLERRAARLTLHALRTDGVLPEVLAGYLAGRVGAARPAEMVAGFDLRRCAAGGFEMPALLRLNRRALAEAPFAAVAGRLPAGATEAFWHAVRGGVDLLAEARGYWDVVAGSIVPPVVEGEEPLLAAARETLPAEPWDDAVWARWTTALAARLERPAAALEAPLRLALTGEEEGPGLAALLPLIGRARVVRRLADAAG